MVIDLFPFIIEPMRVRDISAVMKIERRSFPTPWTEYGYRRELTQNTRARYFVLRTRTAAHDTPSRVAALSSRLLGRLVGHTPAVGQIIGYAGYWLSQREIHITTIAVDPRWRRRGLGEWMLIHLLADAIARQAERATLEVRTSNSVARRLYEKYGFEPLERRQCYYRDGEDALLMMRVGLQQDAFHALLAGRRQQLATVLSQHAYTESE